MRRFKPLPADAPARDENRRYIDRLVSLWNNHNLVISLRITSMVVIQCAITAGWVALFILHQYAASLLTGMLAWIVTRRLAQLIQRDLSAKRSIGVALRYEAGDLLPDSAEPDAKCCITMRLAGSLARCNLLLSLLAAVWWFASSGELTRYGNALLAR